MLAIQIRKEGFIYDRKKREAGDTVLHQNIDKEISDRTAADTLLDNKFP